MGSQVKNKKINNLFNFSEFLKVENVDALLISSVVQITFLTGYANFSSVEREAYILVTPKEKYLFTDARYLEAVREFGAFRVEEISIRMPMRGHLEKLAKKHRIKKLGIEGDNLTVEELRKFEKVISDIKEVKLNQIRAVKTNDEIAKIEKACQLGDKAFKFILKKIKLGISEKELAYELEMNVKMSGAELSFDTIAAFGANSSIPHHHTGNKILTVDSGNLKADGVFIKLDFGTKIENYCSDMTRTVFWGRASIKQKKIYNTVLKAQEKAAEFLDSRIKLGKKVLGKEVDKVARNYIISQGFPLIPHSLGHGIGIEVHESPRLAAKSVDELKAGMVFSIEPGIYIPGFGGVRIEDLFVVEKKGLRKLTKSSSKITEL